MGQLYRLGATAIPQATWVTMTERNTDGSVTPVKPEQKGPESANCAYCGRALVYHASPEAIELISERCPDCGQTSVGARHPNALHPA